MEDKNHSRVRPKLIFHQLVNIRTPRNTTLPLESFFQVNSHVALNQNITGKKILPYTLFFGFTSLAALSFVLEQLNFDIDKAIRAQPSSQIHYESEYKNSAEPKEVLEHHQHWNQLKTILDNGASFPLKPISKKV